jgi:AcrR family transcriptional regulator
MTTSSGRTTSTVRRADSQRTLAAILAAANEVLSRNESAAMEDVALAAGVARTTVHRYFATREDLLAALSIWVAGRLVDSVNSARTDAAPPLVALHQMTVNVLEVKIAWAFALNGRFRDSEAERMHAEVRHSCQRLFDRLKKDGVIESEADIEWVQRVYFALIRETVQNADGMDPDRLAARIVTTLLQGAAQVEIGRPV